MRAGTAPATALATALAVAFVLFAAPAPGVRAGPVREGSAPFRIVPGPYNRRGGDAQDPAARPVRAAASAVLKGLTISVEYLEPPQRTAFIRSVDPRAVDPFAVPQGRPEQFNAFRVEFDNRSTADVSFQPGNVLLMTEGHDQQSPIDLTDLYRSASLAEAPDPQAMIDRTAPFIFDLSTTIPKGRRVERLLVFGPLPVKWKELRLNFSFLQIGTETHSVSFPFHRQAGSG